MADFDGLSGQGRTEEVGGKRKNREEESGDLSGGPEMQDGATSGDAEQRTHQNTGFDHKIAMKNAKAPARAGDGRTHAQT